MDFQNLMQIEFFWRHNLKMLIIYKPSRGPIGHKICARSVSVVLTLIGYKQTDTKTNRQAKYINRRTETAIKLVENDIKKIKKKLMKRKSQNLRSCAEI